MGETLFTIPIERQAKATSQGSITVTRPAARVYLLTFSSSPDNRLTTNFITSFLLALDILEHRYELGVLITTSAIQKFYSNGMDLDHVAATPNFFPETFYIIFLRLATFRMPTVALINGHAFAGGLLLAMYHDYRIQNPDKGYMCMNEVTFGAVLQPPLTAIFREKVSAATLRDLILEGHRFPAKESLKVGLVDGLGGLDATLDFIKKRNLVTMGDTGIYGQLKEDMYRSPVAFLTGHNENEKWRQTIEAEKRVKDEEARKRVETWDRNNGKARL